MSVQFIMINISDGKVRTTFKTFPQGQLPNNLAKHEDDIWAILPDGKMFPMSEEWDGVSFLKPTGELTEDPYLVKCEIVKK